MKVFAYFLVVAFEFAFIRSISIGNKNSETQCMMISMSEEEMKTFREIWQQLHLFLPRNMEDGHERLKEILRDFGGKDLQTSPKDPLESHILQLQLLLHLNTLNMFGRLEKLIQGRKVEALEKENGIGEEIKIPKFKGANDYLKNAYQLFQPNAQITGTLSAFALPQDAPYKPTDSFFRPQDCSDLLVTGAKESGVYTIYPFQCTCSEPVSVYCDMETDGGGWTVFLARQKTENQINFTRNWMDYKTGFGSADGEYWLGNEILHEMTTSRKYHLMMEARAEEGRHVFGEWKTFSVDTEQNKFMLTLADFDTTKGTISDGLKKHNGMQFTTFDVDADKYKDNCAILYKGGWWYTSCHSFNPTGLYGVKGATGARVSPWSKVDTKERTATWLQLKIRPSICSETVSVAELNTHNCKN